MNKKLHISTTNQMRGDYNEEKNGKHVTCAVI